MRQSTSRSTTVSLPPRDDAIVAKLIGARAAAKRLARWVVKRREETTAPGLRVRDVMAKRDVVRPDEAE